MRQAWGEPVSLSKYKGKTLLIVNVASKCSNTPQYAELQALYDEFNGEDFEILAFPANSFMKQEPGAEEEIKQFCTRKYAITFPMFSKISVKGKDMHPLYTFLTQKEQNGVADAKIKWNFQKFLIGKDGKVIANFTPKNRVTSSKTRAQIVATIKAKPKS